MKHVRFFTLLLLALVVALAACAPADLDITPTPVPTPIPMIKVYITGAVAQTGTTLDLPQGSRVEDAIAAAGGATETADLQRVNLAQILRDGDQVNVPAQGDAVVEATPDVAAEAAAAEAAFNDPVAFLDRIVALVPTSFSQPVSPAGRSTGSVIPMHLSVTPPRAVGIRLWSASLTVRGASWKSPTGFGRMPPAPRASSMPSATHSRRSLSPARRTRTIPRRISLGQAGPMAPLPISCVTVM